MRLHLVDGTYELFRAHFSPRPEHRAPGGQPLKATAGLLASLLALLHDEAEAVTHVAVAFDHPIRSFRNDLFEGYKTEEGVPVELLAQFTLAEEATRALGVAAWPMDRFEADDALATAAARWKDEAEQVRILTPDKDLAQCVLGSRVVQVDRRREHVYDEAGVRAKWGVPPGSIPDLLALIGDSADGIPGLQGFGEKGAAMLLSAYGHIEDIPTAPAEWSVKPRGAERLSQTLEAQREDALLYRRLATLVTDAPLTGSLADLAWRGVPRERFEVLCDACGLTTLKKRPRRWA